MHHGDASCWDLSWVLGQPSRECHNPLTRPILGAYDGGGGGDGLGVNPYNKGISCIYDKEITQEQLSNYSNQGKTKRKQICFNDEEIEIINNKMSKVDCNNFNQFITVISLI